MENQIVIRNRKNASTIFKGIPPRFRFYVNGRFFPYSKEAHELINKTK